MLFGKRYGYGPEGLRQLAADLASPTPKQQARAANALRKDGGLRDAVRLVDLAFRVADEQKSMGNFTGDAAKLEALRPIAGITRRLQELASASSGKVRVAAAAALNVYLKEAPAQPAA
jgi:hypothetical protein